MIAKQSEVNPGNIEFYEEAKMVETPLWEFNKEQLETHKARLEADLVRINEMLTFFN